MGEGVFSGFWALGFWEYGFTGILGLRFWA